MGQRIRLLTSIASASYSLAAGEEVEVGREISEATAARLLASKQAEAIGETRTATVKAPERATAPRKKAGRKRVRE